MLQSLHSTASGFFAKALLFLLIASFAVWGIGDIFRSSSGNTIVTVGKTPITAQEFANVVSREQSNLRRMMGEQYSPELFVALGVPQRILQALVQRYLVTEEAKSLGLEIPKEHLLEMMRDNPQFQGPDGNFDRRLFQMVLSQNNTSEGRFLEDVTQGVRADILHDAVFSGVQVPYEAAKLGYFYQHEARTADVLRFGPALIKTIKAPSELELHDYYEARKDAFQTEELRRFSVIMLDANAIAKSHDISDDELQAEYENRLDEYHAPEIRTVNQLLFASKEEAEAAHNALQNGQSFAEAAKAHHATNDEILMEGVTRETILPAAEEAVFALKKGEISEPVESDFGWHVFGVESITEARTRPFAEVKEDLRKDMQLYYAQEEAYTLSTKLQDELAGGAALAEAAQAIGAKVKTYGPMNAEGKTPSGEAVSIPENYGDMVNTAFSLAENETSTLFETDDGSYYAIHMDRVTPAEARPFEEVKAELRKQWEADERADKLHQLATGISSKLASERIENVAVSTGAELMSRKRFTRASTHLNGDKQMLPRSFIEDLFAKAPGAATGAHQMKDGSFIVGKLTAVDQAEDGDAKSKAAIKDVQTQLKDRFAAELYQQYLVYLERKHGVSDVNQALIDQIVQ